MNFNEENDKKGNDFRLKDENTLKEENEQILKTYYKMYNNRNIFPNYNNFQNIGNENKNKTIELENENQKFLKDRHNTNNNKKCYLTIEITDFNKQNKEKKNIDKFTNKYENKRLNGELK